MSVVKSSCIASDGVCEAGRSEGAGRVIEPRNKHSRGHQDTDGLRTPEGSSPGDDKAIGRGLQDTTGVWERGMNSQGRLGNLGEPTVSLPR